MKVNDKDFRTIWISEKTPEIINIIDQRFLPHKFVIEEIHCFQEMVVAIKDMHLRGAGLIGAAAGFGMYLAALEARNINLNTTSAIVNELNTSTSCLNDLEKFNQLIKNSGKILKDSRPTAVNLEWAVNRQLDSISKGNNMDEKIKFTYDTANEIADEDAAFCRKIGLNGYEIIENISKAKNGEVVNILTHCNAGWLAFVDYGSALAPVYEAFNRGIKIHIWVDETRPRNQGASLTAWELLNHGVNHTVVVDNAGGYLMQKGMVDMVIVGADRVTSSGDAANKIGTYLKALAAFDNDIPFYVAIPSSSIDWNTNNGIKEIVIEERDSEEVKFISGLCEDEIKKVLITPAESCVKNYGFDITPARLITGIITERGICKATNKELIKMYPENKH